MEKQVTIRTPDKKVIYGTQNGSSKENVIIFVHGLTGNQNEHIFYNAARFFPKNGYSTFRFDLYSFPKNARKLHTTTIAQQAADVGLVTKHFKKKFKNIFLVGHSLGGPSIMLSELSGIRGIVLWDPSVGGTDIEGRYSKPLDAIILEWSVNHIMSKQMLDEWRKLPNQPALVRKTSVPARIILAGKENLRKSWSKAKDQIIIRNATHCFDEEGAEEELFKHTLDFLKRYSKT